MCNANLNSKDESREERFAFPDARPSALVTRIVADDDDGNKSATKRQRSVIFIAATADDYEVAGNGTRSKCKQTSSERVSFCSNAREPTAPAEVIWFRLVARKISC